MEKITFSKDETIRLLNDLPVYSDILKDMNGVDVFDELESKSPKDIVTKILEGVPYENSTENTV